MKLFGGGKPDHPMADLKDARRILEELPAQDPFKALEDLAHWMESVSTVEGFRPEARVQTLLAVDEAAAPRLRRLGRDYVAATRPSRYTENRIWTAVHGYYRQAAQAFARALDPLRETKRADPLKGQLPLLLARALRCAGQQIKWMHMRYGPVDPAAWGILNGAYALAESRQAAQARTTVYPGASGESTPQLEFLKGAMFGASSPDGLLPVEIEIAERLIAELAPRFALAAVPAPQLGFWTDLAQAIAPRRLLRPPAAAPGLRCFGPGAALAELEARADHVRGTGEVPASLSVGGPDDPDAVLGVMEHLATCWSPHPPERKAKRHSVKSRLAVVHGFDGVLGALGASGSLDFGGQGGESWVVENVSTGGFGAFVQPVKGDWLRVGALLAMQPEGGDNWLVGLVRRVSKTGALEARVGIQTLSRQPQVAQLAVSGAGSASEQGVLLPDPAGTPGETCIALRSGVYAPVQNFASMQSGRQLVYLPLGMAERGEDYEIARFREMIRES
jgi:hypothetical protein